MSGTKKTEKHIFCQETTKKEIGNLMSKGDTWDEGLNKIIKFIKDNWDEYLKFRDK